MTEEHVNVDAYILSKLSGNTFKSDSAKTYFFGRARRAWAKLYGHARARGKFCRSDKGRPNPRRAGLAGKKTETSFLKRRRVSVDAGVRAAKVVRKTAPEPYWTDTHTKELDFQQKKYAKNKVTAYKDGVLLASEITEDLRHQNTLEEMNEARRYLERDKQHSDRNLKRVEHTPLVFQGKSVYVDPNTTALSNNGSLTRAINKVGGKTTTNRENANVFVVDCVASPGLKNQWCLALGGGIACTEEYVVSEMKRGVALAFKSALATKRSYCITEDFAEMHPAITAIVAVKASRRGS
eukprot:15455195-Alexandrium_andersonii.AAC.1